MSWSKEQDRMYSAREADTRVLWASTQRGTLAEGKNASKRAHRAKTRVERQRAIYHAQRDPAHVGRVPKIKLRRAIPG